MTKAQLYLLRADLLLCKHGCMRVSKGVKAKILRQVQLLLQIGEDVRQGGQCHGLTYIFEGAEDIVILRETNALRE